MILTRKLGQYTKPTLTCGFSIPRKTAWATLTCRRRSDACSANVLDEWGFTLERYALHSVENCPDKPVRLAFDSDIQLTAPEITISDGLLRLDAHFRSADDYLLAYYSLAVHVIEAQSGERVAQGDTGVGPGAIVPLRSEIDVSTLPPGDYELRVALYDWQTGARLPARDLETGEDGDMHTLHHFRLG